MRQVFQDLRSGNIELLDVPAPAAKPGHVVVRSRASLVSAGTERMLVDFGKANWLERARQQPDKVRQVIAKARTDGILATIEAVQSKLDSPMAMGYSNVGVIEAVGPGVTSLVVGDRIVSNGPHAEVVSVPLNLCARVPDSVPDEHAAFAVLGAVALQGVRLAAPSLGEIVAVSGAGLIGLLAIQILRANGCRVVALEVDTQRLALAESLGAIAIPAGDNDDPVTRVLDMTGGIGVDAVLVCAVSESSQPISVAAQISRKRGRIVLVGVTGLSLSRAEFYAKELTFQVSCSYGPGRYDPSYEEKGVDYPIGYVRWTEQRNIAAILDLMAEGRVKCGPLVSHTFAFEDAKRAYDLLTSGSPSLGIILRYDVTKRDSMEQTVAVSAAHPGRAAAGRRIAILGAGDYARRFLLPGIERAGGRVVMVGERGGALAAHAARRFAIPEATTDIGRLFDPNRVDAIVIATRHESHANYVQRALVAGLHVYVEKPLALAVGDVQEIRRVYEDAKRASSPLLTVGFNRRFAPLARDAWDLVRRTGEPVSIIITVNAGALPLGHWAVDPSVGGDRITGEGCHFIDLARYIAASRISSWQVARGAGPRHDPGAMIELTFESGSTAMIAYVTTGSKSFPKERVEIFGMGRVIQIDNWRRLRTWGYPYRPGRRMFRQDKGNAALIAAFVQAVASGGPAPIPVEELLEVSEVAARIGARLAEL